MNSPPKRKAISSTSTIVLTIALIAIIFGAFTFVIFHAHLQLGNEQENTRLFIKNQINKFEESLISNVKAEEKIIERYMHSFEKAAPERDIYPIITPQNSVHEAVMIETKPAIVRTPVHHELKCPNADLVKFWKPTTADDMAYRSPYAVEGSESKYVTFEPDVGGWNNIRMQMETVLVFAASTGRTLVLPPDQPMYLLNAGKGHQKAHSFADFFPFHLINDRVPVISMQEFMAKEGVTGGLRRTDNNLVQLPPNNKTEFIGTVRDDRLSMWEYLRNVTTCPTWKCMKEFVVIPPGPGVNVTFFKNAGEYKRKLDIFAVNRQPRYYDDKYFDKKVIHFISKPGEGFRLLEHFYTFIHFEDEAMDRYYKRFVRDFVHYTDTIFCKAAIIINKLNEEGHGIYSSFHIRRGEFQYKEVKIPGDQLIANVGQFIPKNELIFIATDEKNKTFFKAFKERFPVIRYLDDYMEIAGLRSINPNYLGMIDQIVCTRGHIFVGTWFSTFSGYITRMRGYMGYHDHTTYYGDKKHRDRFQHDELPMFPFYMREWNVSWVNIDK